MFSKIFKRPMILTLMLLTVIAGFTEIVKTKALASDIGPDILITEIMPKSQDADDAYEYIELYNNSENSIDLKDYKFAYPNIDINASKVIPSKGVVVLCTRSDTTLEKFNAFYKASLTEDKYMVLPLAYEALDNNSQCIALARDDGSVVVMAKYNSTNFAVRKSINYTYPQSGVYMTLLSSKQEPGPGTVTVEQIPYEGISVTGITINNDILNMEVGQTANLVATVTPATASNKSVVWSSSASGIAEVNQNGVVTAKSAGTCFITAKTVDGDFRASCSVFVDRVPVKGISLDKTDASVYVGKSIVLTASISPGNATNKSVTWSSGNSNVASVASNGVVKGIAPGTAKITVRTSDGGYTDSCIVTVIKSDTYIPVTGIALDKPTAEIEIGGAVALKATVKPSNATNKKVLWISSNNSIAEVNQNGVVYGKSLGTAYITAWTEDKGYNASCIVTVKAETDDTIVVKGVKLNTHLMIMNKGETEDLDASIIPYDADNKNVTWSSDNTDVASVDQNGKVRTLKDGVAIITVKTVEGGYADRCVVIVGNYSFDGHDGHSKINGISINKSIIYLFSSQTEKVNAKISPSNVHNIKIVWSTSDSSVATVSKDGKITGHDSGIAVITASTEDGSYKAKCYVCVADKNKKSKKKGWDWGWGHWKR